MAFESAKAEVSSKKAAKKTEAANREALGGKRPDPRAERTAADAHRYAAMDWRRAGNPQRASFHEAEEAKHRAQAGVHGASERDKPRFGEGPQWSKKPSLEKQQKTEADLIEATRNFPTSIQFEGKRFSRTSKVGTNMKTGEPSAEYRCYGTAGRDEDDRVWRTASGKVARD